MVMKCGDEMGATRLLDRVNGHDVGMVECRHCLGFALKPSQPIKVGSHFLWQHFDRDIPIEALIAGAVHLPHPALADLLDDAVVPKGATDEVLHCWGSQPAYGIAAKGALRDWRWLSVELGCARRAPRGSTLPPSRRATLLAAPRSKEGQPLFRFWKR
jgi:hypothetical protein